MVDILPSGVEMRSVERAAEDNLHASPFTCPIGS
jgi:hypothetical protein